MSWHRIKLSVDDVLNFKHMQIQDAFAKLFLALRAPKDAALFSSEFDRNDFLYMYFSPSSIAFCKGIIAIYGGEPCDPPDRSALGLLVGYQNAWDLLSPGPIGRDRES